MTGNSGAHSMCQACGEILRIFAEFQTRPLCPLSRKLPILQSLAGCNVGLLDRAQFDSSVSVRLLAIGRWEEPHAGAVSQGTSASPVYSCFRKMSLNCTVIGFPARSWSPRIPFRSKCPASRSMSSEHLMPLMLRMMCCPSATI